MKLILTLTMTLAMTLATGIAAQNEQTVNTVTTTADRDTTYTVHEINQKQFKQLIADWNASTWSMRGPRPVVVDFNASWCLPCKKLAPILQRIAQHYAGAVDFYSIDVETNPDVANALKVRNIPTLLICPIKGDPQPVVGLYPEQELIRRIDQAVN